MFICVLYLRHCVLAGGMFVYIVGYLLSVNFVRLIKISSWEFVQHESFIGSIVSYCIRARNHYSKGAAISYPVKHHNAFKKSAPKIALKTTAIIKTHLNVHQSPKFNVSEQVTYVGIEVLLMACRLGPFLGFPMCVNVVPHSLLHPFWSGILVLRQGLLYKIRDFLYGQQHSLLLASGLIVSLCGAWRYAVMENVIGIGFSCCFCDT